MKDTAQKRALALVLAAAIFAVAAPAAVADNTDQSVVATVYPAGAAPFQDSTTIGQLESSCPEFTGPAPAQVSSGGSLAQTPSAEAWTLGSVLGCLPTPITVAAVNSLVVVSEQGTPETGPDSVLTQADLNTPSDFLSPAESPLIFSDGTNIIYQRPQRTAGDLNAGDEVTVGDQAFAFQVFEGATLSVGITPSQSTATAGANVSFSATGVPAGDQATYAWNFGGGATASAQAGPTVAFATAGVYTVTLTVTDATAGSVGIATTQITVGVVTPTQTSTTPRTVGPTHGSHGGTVGAPAKAKTTPTRTTKVPPPARTTPIAKKQPKPTHTTQVRTTPAEPTPTHTASTPATTTPPRTTTTSSSAGGGPGPATRTSGSTAAPGQGTTTAAGTSAPAATTTPAVTTAPASPPAAKPTHSASKPKPEPKPKPKPKRQPKPKPKPTRTQPTSTPTPSKPAGQRVSGLLLASITPVPAGASALVHTVKPAAVGGAASLSGSPGKSPWPAIAGAAAALLLLTLGAARELSARGGRRSHD